MCMVKRGRLNNLARFAALFAALFAEGLLMPGCSWFGGNFDGSPAQMDEAIGQLARQLIRQAYEGLPTDRIVDHHVHLVGTGAALPLEFEGVSNSDCYVNDDLFRWSNPLLRIKTAVFMSACGVSDREQVDGQYAERLLSLVANVPHGRFLLMAFAAYRDDNGTVNWERTQFHVPNRYAIEVSNHLNRRLGQDRFVPVGSVHPYDARALKELERLHQAGVRFIKWLPNAMNIDPADPRCVPFYRELARLGLVLLSHTGDETTVRTPAGQALGNPLLLIHALENGATVVMLHCGRDGTGIDLNDPAHPRRPNFELFLDLMTLPAYQRYRGRLFGDISALTIPQHSDQLFRLIEDRRLHGRLVNGSDYPIPAFNILTPTRSILWPTRSLLAQNALTRDEALALEEIYAYNPLLFDFVVKRTLRHPKTGERLPDSVFLELPLAEEHRGLNPSGR